MTWENKMWRVRWCKSVNYASSGRADVPMHAGGTFPELMNRRCLPRQKKSTSGFLVDRPFKSCQLTSSFQPGNLLRWLDPTVLSFSRRFQPRPFHQLPALWLALLVVLRAGPSNFIQRRGRYVNRIKGMEPTSPDTLDPCQRDKAISFSSGSSVHFAWVFKSHRISIGYI